MQEQFHGVLVFDRYTAVVILLLAVSLTCSDVLTHRSVNTERSLMIVKFIISLFM